MTSQVFNDLRHTSETKLEYSESLIQDENPPGVQPNPAHGVFSNNQHKSSDTNAVYNIKKSKLKQSISGVAKKLGVGIIDPVPYDTAWVARVPQADDLSRPAFPLCLQWLRDNQMKNGYWGATKPFSPCSVTLNTLAAIIALAQWDEPEDKARIERGITALWSLTTLQSTDGKPDGVGFELLLPALTAEAHKYCLAVPFEHYKIYEDKSRKKLALIHSVFEEHEFTRPATWWHNLEILGDSTTIYNEDKIVGFSLSMLCNDGSIGASPSASAYILRLHRLKGIDIPETDEYLKKLYSLYQGGIPQVYPIDLFELAFSLDYFLQAGFSMKNPLFKHPIRRLQELGKDTIGFSSEFKIPDADDTAVALNVLHHAGSTISTRSVLKFFNGTHILTFSEEMNASLSANVNALRMLRLFQNTPEVIPVIQNISNYIETLSCSDERIFDIDKWHISPYYGCSRAVFALLGLKDDIVARCFYFFLKSQNDDGGWGEDAFSTAEETAYVSLALCFGIKHGYHIPEASLEMANKFLSSIQNHCVAQLWVGKVLYRPSLVAESAILAARSALLKMLELKKLSIVLKDALIDCIKVEINVDNEEIYCGSLYCTSPEFDVSKYSTLTDRVRNHIIERLIELKLIKTRDSVVKTLTPEGCMYAMRDHNVSDEHLKCHALLTMATFVCDDVLDKHWQMFRSNPDILNQVFHTFLEILRGKFQKVDDIPSIEFPKFLPLCKVFFDVRLTLMRKPNIEDFLFEVEESFQYSVKDIKNRINGKTLSSKEFLDLGKNTSLYGIFYHLSCVFEDVQHSSFAGVEHFRKYQHHARKISRLVMDIFSVGRDLEEGNSFDNYILLKRDEENISLRDAFNATLHLCNKQLLKLFYQKRSMQNDLFYRNNEQLFKAIRCTEKLLQGFLDWAPRVQRYSSKTNNSVSVRREKCSEVETNDGIPITDTKKTFMKI